jgi:hypothetical protein
MPQRRELIALQHEVLPVLWGELKLTRGTCIVVQGVWSWANGGVKMTRANAIRRRAS